MHNDWFGAIRVFVFESRFSSASSASVESGERVIANEWFIWKKIKWKTIEAMSWNIILINAMVESCKRAKRVEPIQRRANERMNSGIVTY